MSDLRADAQAAADGFDGKVCVLEDLRSDLAFSVPADVLREFVGRLKDIGFHFLSFITAVDNYLDEPRFEVTYRLRSLDHNLDVRLNVPVPGENPEVASITDLFPAANWLEREVWDMFGVRFAGHPNLERILMWEGFEGHPLRKDYPLLGNTPGTPGFLGKGGKQ